MNGLQQAIQYIGHEQGTNLRGNTLPTCSQTKKRPSQSEEIKIDIDF